MLKAQKTNKVHVIVFISTCCLIGLWYAYRYGNNTWLLGALIASLILILIAIYRHQHFLWLTDIWMKLNHMLTAVLFYLLLGGVFFLLITPIALYRKLTSKKSMPTVFDPTIESYITSSPTLHEQELDRPY